MDNTCDWAERALQRQLGYENQYYEWKEYDTNCRQLLKTNIGLLLFGPADTSDSYVPLILYHRCYEPKQRENIDNIYGKIINLLSNSSYIQFSHTVLSAKADKEFEYVIFRCRSSHSLNNIYFIEPNGRVYSSWEDFKNNNKLPPCRYIAPKNGTYIKDGDYVNFQSPAAKNGFVTKFADWLTTAATVGCITAGILAVAPVTTAVTGVGIGIYGTAQSVRVLRDRYTHDESIRLDNRESVFNYANIVASGLGGISSLAASNINRIRSLAGNYGTLATRTVKFVNYATLVFDTGFFAANLIDCYQKCEAGQFSAKDAFHLSLQAFLLYGSVCNVREIHEVLSPNNQTPVASGTLNVSNKKLTKSQKRNMRRRRAKALKRQQQNALGTVRVAESDAYSSIKMVARSAGSVGVKILLQKFPRAEIIYEEFNDMWKLCYAYFKERSMNFATFTGGLQTHLNNLYTIIIRDLDEIKIFFERFFPGAPRTDNVAQVFNNEYDRVNQAEQDIRDVVANEEINNVDAEVTVDDNRLEQRSYVERWPIHKIILDASKYVASQRKTSETSVEAITVFYDALSFVCTKLLQQKCKYDDLYDKNKNKVGEEKAKKMFVALGTKTDDDFIFKDEIFDKLIEEIRNEGDDFWSNYYTGAEKVDASMTPLPSEIINHLQNVFENFFSMTVNANEKLGLGKTVEVLQCISDSLVKKLVRDVQTKNTEVALLYQENLEVVGEEMAKAILENIGLYTDEFYNFKCVVEELNNDFAIDVVKKCSRICAVSRTSCVENLEQNFEDDQLVDNMSLFFSVCDKFYRNLVIIDSICEEDKADIYKRIIHFMAEKFTKELEILKGTYEEMKLFNVDVVGAKVFKVMLSNIGLFDEKQSFLFKEISQKLINDDSLMQDYFEYYDTNRPDFDHIKMWENTIGDEGFSSYITECHLGRPDEYYRTFASNLFKIEIDGNADVERNLNIIVLKSQNNVITFKFSEERNDEAIVVLTDLCVHMKEDEIS